MSSRRRTLRRPGVRERTNSHHVRPVSELANHHGRRRPAHPVDYVRLKAGEDCDEYNDRDNRHLDSFAQEDPTKKAAPEEQRMWLCLVKEVGSDNRRYE